MSMIEKKNYLDFEGLSQYDELIKKFIQDKAVNTSETALAAITALGEKVAANADALAILNGEDEGSVKKTVDDAIAALVDGAPETLDTLKEIASWIENDETGTANLISRVATNEESIEDLKKENEDLKAYVDAQDKAYFDAIQSIGDLSIQSLFPVQQEEGQSAAAAISAVKAGGAVQLTAGQTVAEDIVIDKSCHIDANGAVFEGNVTIPADADVVIENATFAKPVIMA